MTPHLKCLTSLYMNISRKQLTSRGILFNSCKDAPHPDRSLDRIEKVLIMTINLIFWPNLFIFMVRRSFTLYTSKIRGHELESNEYASACQEGSLIGDFWGTQFWDALYVTEYPDLYNHCPAGQNDYQLQFTLGTNNIKTISAPVLHFTNFHDTYWVRSFSGKNYIFRFL